MSEPGAGFDLVFSTEFPAVLRSVSLIVRDVDRATRITEDAFVQLLGRWRKVSRRDDPGTWVRRVAIHLARNAAWHERLHSFLGRGLRPGPAVAGGEAFPAIRDLPLMERAVIVLFLVEDRPLPEVARLIESSNVSVRGHLLRARNRLARALGDEDPVNLDARLRAALERSAPIVDPDVGHALLAVRRRTGHVVLRRRIGVAVAIAALALGAVVLGPRALDILRTEHPVAAGSPAPPAAFTGFYNTDLGGASEPLASARLAGAWTLVFDPDGTVLWTASGRSGLAEGHPPDTFRWSGRRIETNLFSPELCADDGAATYSWSRVGSTLTLVVVEDPCAIRRAILTTQDWAVG